MPGTLAEVALKNAGDAAIFVSHKYSDANTDAPTRAFSRPRCTPRLSVPTWRVWICNTAKQAGVVPRT
jgi:hypothetical protein